MKDVTLKTRTRARFDRVEMGNLGDYKSLGGGVYELRFKQGARIYFGQIGTVVVLLLHGGMKKSQHKDIVKAKEYWRTFNE